MAPIGPCHNCGEFGHLRYACPKLKMPNKYPFMVASDSGVNADVVACEGDTCCMNDGVNEHVVAPDVCQGYSSNSTPCRLRDNIACWESIVKAPEFIISIVRQGYILPFVSVPMERFFKNHKSAFVHSKFVSETVSDLLSNGCIRQMATRPTVCSPLLVVVGSTGKKRLVINLRYVNAFLRIEKFKYEDMRTALMLLEKDDFICTFDLKSGYHHVDIHAESQQFQGFEWDHKYYVFSVTFWAVHCVLCIYQVNEATH